MSKAPIQNDIVSGSEIYRFVTQQFLHENELGWSRLRIIMLLETAMIGWFFSANIKTSIYLSITGMLVSSFIIVILFVLMNRSWDVRDQNTAWINQVHDDFCQRNNGVPEKIHVLKPARLSILSGRKLIKVIVYGSIIGNMFLIIGRYSMHI